MSANITYYVKGHKLVVAWVEVDAVTAEEAMEKIDMIDFIPVTAYDPQDPTLPEDCPFVRTSTPFGLVD